MPSKYAPHVHQPSAAVDDFITRAAAHQPGQPCPLAAVKSFNDTQPLHTAAAAGVPVRILRLYNIETSDPGPAVARWLQQDLAPVTHIQLCCESARGYDPVWQREVIDGLRAGGFGGVCLLGGFPVGNPKTIVDTPDGKHFPELEPLYPLFALPNVGLAVDEYSGILPSDTAGWAEWAPYTSQRHRYILADLARQGFRPPVVITESGRDAAQPDLSPGGWLAKGWSHADYMALVAALDAGDQADDLVICRCYFTLNATQDWASFETSSLSDELVRYVQQGATTVTPTPSPVPAPVPVPAQPAAGPIFQFDQGYTKDCWVRCIQAFFLRYGYPVDLDTVFQAGKGRARPAGGEAATFSEVKQALTTLSTQLGAQLQLADFDAPNIVMAALHDPDTTNPWTVIAGVAEQDLQGQTQAYGHYLIPYQVDTKGYVYVIDSYAAEDGNTTGKYPWSQFATAMIDNFDVAIDAIGVKLLATAA